jgi:hypothetical protein
MLSEATSRRSNLGKLKVGACNSTRKKEYERGKEMRGRGGREWGSGGKFNERALK